MDRLSALPPELTSHICRYLGRKVNQDDTSEVEYDDSDLCSLRMSCRTLYINTLYDASIRFPLRHIMLTFNYFSLVILLQLTANGRLRQRIRSIRLFQDDGLGGPTPPRDDWRSRVSYTGTEEARSFARSLAAVDILTQCLQHLRSSVDFEVITYVPGVDDVLGQMAVLDAVDAAQLPRKVVRVPIDLKSITESCAANFNHLFRLYKPLILDANILIPAFHHERNPGPHHLQHFHLAHPNLDQVYRAIGVIPNLSVKGSNTDPELDLDKDCHDVFVPLIAPNTFSQLSRLELTDLYVNGRRLGRFIEDNASSLEVFSVEHVRLMKGSWDNIANTLREFCQLKHLSMCGGLYQKKGTFPAEAWKELPPNKADTKLTVYVWGQWNVSYYLCKWQQHFRVFRNRPGKVSNYVKVCLFNIPLVSRGESENEVVLRNYAFEYDG